MTSTPDPLTTAAAKLARATQYEAPRNDVLVRLAEEGVPMAAMARAFALPYGDVVQLLQEAVDASRIIMLPAPDWPPGQRRSERLPTTPPLRGNNPNSLAATLCVVFGLGPAQSRILVQLIKHEHVTKEHLHVAISKNSNPTTDQKIVDVIICKMRKRLNAHGVKITTVWGMGYRLPHESRAIIKQKVAEAQVTPEVTAAVQSAAEGENDVGEE